MLGFAESSCASNSRFTKMNLTEKFNRATVEVKRLRNTPNDEDLLTLYGYYKQATIGDNNTSEPNVIDMKSTAKWQAWWKYRGMNHDKAMEAYIQQVEYLISKYND